MPTSIAPLRIPDADRRRLKIMFIAKHALGDGSLHSEDGNHAVYHYEIRKILEGLNLNLTVANSYRALFEKPDVDFVFPLLNRGGFMNSEMMLPLLCNMHGLPYLGASPILRGLSDDKHLTKLCTVARGVPTLPWAIYRRGAPVLEAACPKGERFVVKPNASSASWGVGDARDWAGVRAGVERIHAEGHDAIVEPFMHGSDIEVPVIFKGEPVIMPMMEFRQADPTHLRTYQEKRDLVERAQKYQLLAFEDPELAGRITAYTQNLIGEFRPFDYGRFEFRYNPATRELNFLEVNLNCNLWSQKVFGQSAILAGMNQAQLIETILCDSLRRHGLLKG